VKLKYAKSKLGRIEFHYSEGMSNRGDGKLWNKNMIEAYLNGERVGYLKMNYIKNDTFKKVMPTAEGFSKYFYDMGRVYEGERLRKEYKDFYYHWVDCPMVDYIKVESKYRRSGIGYILYIAGAMWMADKNMALHASSLQEPEAEAAWDKLEKVGLPIKTYKNPAGEKRKTLDYRGRHNNKFGA
jgi:hypothetical protein